MSTFAFGVILIAGGLAVVVADLSSLRFDQTASVAALAGGAVVLIAATMAPRGPSPTGPGPTVDDIADADDGPGEEGF